MQQRWWCVGLVGVIACGAGGATVDPTPGPEMDHVARIRARVDLADGTLDGAAAVAGVRAYLWQGVDECGGAGSCACADGGSSTFARMTYDAGWTVVTNTVVHACGGDDGHAYAYGHFDPKPRPVSEGEDPSTVFAYDVDVTVRGVHWAFADYRTAQTSRRWSIPVADGAVRFELVPDDTHFTEDTFAATDRFGTWTCKESGASVTCTTDGRPAITGNL